MTGGKENVKRENNGFREKIEGTSAKEESKKVQIVLREIQKMRAKMKCERRN